MIIGSHVSMCAPEYVLGSVKEMLSYRANACMFYTGAPQNGNRVAIEKLRINEAKALLEEKNLPLNHIVVHAPYLINLANTLNPDTYANSVELLKNEIIRCDAIGSPFLVLHPGCHLNAGIQKGIESIAQGLHEACQISHKCCICIETMAGKGSECGKIFEEIHEILRLCTDLNLGVCLDTCHIHDSGYDLNNFESVLKEFDEHIGLDYLKVVHLNDSKNFCGSHKDRHENIGHGKIGFENLLKIAHHPKLQNILFILETPYIEKMPPYKEEIEMIRSNEFIKLK